jgi:membrane associated rhomboid family serine protease
MLTPWVTRIIFANVVMFLLQNLGARSGSIGPLLDMLELRPAYILVQPWTVVTYMFLHQNVGHIFFNMLALFFFGPRVEAQIGGSRFLGLYLTSGIAGALFCWVFSPGAIIIGASGAVLGVETGYVRFWPRDRILFFFLPVEAWLAVAIYAGIDLYYGLHGGDGIAHFAHLGGIIAAIAYMGLLELGSRRRRFEAKLRAPRVSRSDVARWSKIRRDELHAVNREELDRIMQKIEKEGVGSVTPQERVFLDNFSERHGG